MWKFINNLFFGNRIVSIEQFMDKQRKPHVYVITGRKVVELDVNCNEVGVVCTSKMIKEAKDA